MHSYGFLTKLLAFLVLAQAAVSCPYLECQCSGDVINCHSSALTQLPTLVPSTETYKRLRIFNNQITSIADHQLPAGLEEIDLSGNPVSAISPAAFNDTASTLQVLVLTNAMLTSLPSALRSLTNLRSLTLTNVPIQHWSLDVLQDIGRSLDTLALNNVGLTSWPDWLDSLPHLTTLKLANTPISTVPDNALAQVAANLQTFSLTSANLSSVPAVTASMSSLQTLDLSDNHIREVDNLPSAAALANLYLNRNQISDSAKLSQQLSYFADSLTYLYINNNQLTSIPDLLNMKSLVTVSLRDNLISDPASGSLSSSIFILELTDNQLAAIPDAVRRSTGLKRLSIANNQIVDINATSIPLQLTALDISDNLITHLTDASFPTDSSMQSLDLSNNPVTSISSSAFFGLARLTKLVLHDTRLARVPLALASLRSLTSLDLTNNRNLICTCVEASLVTWFKSLPNLAVSGGCGELTVTEFYNEVAPNCPAQS